MSVSGALTGGGGAGMEEILRLLADPSIVDNRLKEVADLEARARAASDALGSTESIPVLLEKAEADRKAAAEILAKASLRAHAMIDEAASKAAISIQDAEYRLSSAMVHEQEVTAGMKRLHDETRAAAEAMNRESRDIRDKLAATALQLAADQEALRKEQEKLAADQQATNELRFTTEAKLLKMNEIWGGS